MDRNIFDQVKSGNWQGLKERLESGENPDVLDGAGSSPLLLAIARNSIRCIEVLLENDADPDFYDKSAGLPPLFAAIANQLPEVVKLLLKYNAKTSIDDLEGISFSIGCGNEEIFKLLVEQGLPVNAVSAYKITPLHAAVFARSAASVRYLLDAGANPDAKDARGFTPKDYAQDMDDTEIIELLSRG